MTIVGTEGRIHSTGEGGHTKGPIFPIDADGMRCARCDYDLRGILVPTCPECGLEFSFSEVVSRSPKKGVVDKMASCWFGISPRLRFVIIASSLVALLVYLGLLGPPQVAG